MPFRIVVCLFLLGGNLCAQQYRMDHFGIKDGLSQNTVNCVLKDSEGYYWFGTQDGLNRYDGYDIKVYRNERGDSTTLSDNFVLGITEDDWGNLWVGTRNGLNHFNKKTSVYTRVKLSEKENEEYHNDIRFVCRDAQGNILFNSRAYSFGKITKGDAMEAPFNPKKDTGSVLIGISSNAHCAVRDKKSKKVSFSMHKAAVSSIEIDVAARIQFAERKGEIFLSGKGLRVVRAGKNAPEIVSEFWKDKKINAVLCDRNLNLWVATNEGLFVIDKNEEIITLLHNEANIYSLSSNGVESIYEDPDGLIWIGTSEGGLNIYDPAKEVFVIVNHYAPVSLPSNPVWAIYQDKNELWAGTSDGASHFTLKSGTLQGLEKDISASEVLGEKIMKDKFVTCIIKDKNGNTWFGTRSKGIVIRDATEKLTYLNTLNSTLRSDVIFHLFCDKDGDVWISTMRGFYCYHSASKKLENFVPGESVHKEFRSGYIFSVYQDSRGTIWIGTTAGINRYEKEKGKFTLYQSKPGDTTSLSYLMATGFYEDSKGRFWVTTLGGGIDLMDRKKGTFRSFTKKNGLANNITYCMLEDKKGLLWISSNGGLSSFDPVSMRFKNYGTREGVVANEFIQNAAFKNEAGQLMFGSPEGMVVFDPQKVNEPLQNIPIVLTDLKINYKSSIPGTAIDLFYGDQTITFEFAAIDFRSRDKISYAFKLEGFDPQWNDVSSSVRLASYSSLPFGEYTFKVRARIGNNDWQEKQFAIPVKVIPPFWLSTWFIVLEVLTAVILLGLFIRYYSQRKLKAKLREVEVQHKIQLERERISRDLHDNVGSNLTYIISTLDSISDRFEKIPSGQAQVKIESLGDFTRSTMQQLRETIWVINKGSVTINEFREKVREHIAKMLSVGGNIKFNVETKGDTSIALKPSLAIHLFRIVQEAVNNSIKHSAAADLEVAITTNDGNSICVIIKDNGKGFTDAEKKDGHYGLINMKARAEEVGGELILSSESGKGTTITLIAPYK